MGAGKNQFYFFANTDYCGLAHNTACHTAVPTHGYVSVHSLRCRQPRPARFSWLNYNHFLSVKGMKYSKPQEGITMPDFWGFFVVKICF